MMKKLLILLLIVSGNLAMSQEKKKEESDKKDEKTIADLTKSSKKIEGLFTIFQDTLTGDVKMVLKEKSTKRRFYLFFSNR